MFGVSGSVFFFWGKEGREGKKGWRGEEEEGGREIMWQGRVWDGEGR